jgi:hypothetical protein
METTPHNIEILTDITPTFNEQALLRYLGYPKGEEPDARVVDALAAQNKLLPDLLRPRGACGIFTGSVCFKPDFPLYDREIYLCVVTIGDKLEKRAADYAAAGDVLDSFVLDTLGSVYAEGAAAAAYQKFYQDARTDELQVGCRISPGYGTWSLEHQKDIFTLLPVEKIGVRLSPGLMMIPRKSVSFAAERSAAPLRLREGEQCDNCEVDNCRYRQNAKPSS